MNNKISFIEKKIPKIVFFLTLERYAFQQKKKLITVSVFIANHVMDRGVHTRNRTHNTISTVFLVQS